MKSLPGSADPRSDWEVDLAMPFLLLAWIFYVVC